MSTRYKNNIKGLHEADWLALEVAKARVALGVSSKWTLTEAVNRTMAWYLAQQMALMRGRCVSRRLPLTRHLYEPICNYRSAFGWI